MFGTRLRSQGAISYVPKLAVDEKIGGWLPFPLKGKALKLNFQLVKVIRPWEKQVGKAQGSIMGWS